ncbi:MAG: hybrid sensor histidine kinase/response regulator, partial [Gemmatimonadales bacterium]
NNLLTGILGNASLALHTMPRGSPAARMVSEVVKASRRAAALTGQLLAYAGKGQFQVEPVDLAKLVHDIGGLLRASLPKKVCVELDAGDALPLVKADPSQLQQVIMNLVINGAEAIGPRSGTVRIRTGVVRLTEADLAVHFPGFDIGPGAYLRLEVSDTGSGMDSDTLARIFDPFFTTKFMGRGLGLAATLGIVRGHKGAIAVHSEPGEGSVFTLVLPAMTTTVDRTEPPPEVEGRWGTEVILVVDDEVVVRRTARAALEGYGYRVLEAADGLEALECFRKRPNDIALALLDMTMPAMSGDEAARQCLRIRPDLPIIASSGYGELEAKRRFSDIPIRGFLQKPYSAEQLIDLVGRLLGSPAA